MLWLAGDRACLACICLAFLAWVALPAQVCEALPGSHSDYGAPLAFHDACSTTLHVELSPAVSGCRDDTPSSSDFVWRPRKVSSQRALTCKIFLAWGTSALHADALFCCKFARLLIRMKTPGLLG